MRIYDFVDEGLGHSSYLIDSGDATAALVDPPRFPAPHEALAAQLGLRIKLTFDTHSHADYLTGSPGLVARLDTTFVAPAASRLRTPHRPITDMDAIDLRPGLRIVALATPGHTPDHHTYLLQQSGNPVALFSGGSLMVGAVGRTDLCGPELAEPLAREMFRSLRRFEDLPADLIVYPTHGAGSFCAAPGSSQRSTTIGHERATNTLFAITEENRFVEQLLTGFGTFPGYFAHLPEINRLGPARYDTVPHLNTCNVAELERVIASGGAVIDARPVPAFAAGHLPGSISNTLRPVFASWLGWLVAADRPLAFILDPDQDREDLVRQCLDIGHEHLLGELEGGINTWTTAGRPTVTTALVDPSHITGRLLDVRQTNEYATGHIPGTLNVELARVASTELPDGPLTIMCGHGERAMTGASLLIARGRTDVHVLDGGPDTWSAATGMALVTGR